VSHSSEEDAVPEASLPATRHWCGPFSFSCTALLPSYSFPAAPFVSLPPRERSAREDLQSAMESHAAARCSAHTIWKGTYPAVFHRAPSAHIPACSRHRHGGGRCCRCNCGWAGMRNRCYAALPTLAVHKAHIGAACKGIVPQVHRTLRPSTVILATRLDTRPLP
jgi:hypothetical protein